MNAISASRTACCIGSLVAPSKVKLLITGYHYVQHHGYHYGAPLGSELLLIRPSGN
jgi:hypothetical protein